MNLTRQERTQLAAIEHQLAAEDPHLDRALTDLDARPLGINSPARLVVAGLATLAGSAVATAVGGSAVAPAATAVLIAGLLSALAGLGAAARHGIRRRTAHSKTNRVSS